MDEEVNDGRFPDESPVEVGCPRRRPEEHGDRERWPWLPGTTMEQCGPDEWYVCIEVRELALLRDGRRTPRLAMACAVAAFAAVVSYSYIYRLGRAHGQDGRAARLLGRGFKDPDGTVPTFSLRPWNDFAAD